METPQGPAPVGFPYRSYMETPQGPAPVGFPYRGIFSRVKKHKEWLGKSKMFDSVQECEARAILKAIQEANIGEAIHIHTDSKGTIQKIRAIMGKSYTLLKIPLYGNPTGAGPCGVSIWDP